MSNRVTGRIGKERYPEVERMIAERMTAPEIGAALGVNKETVHKYARKRGLKIEPTPPLGGENHPSWKGGTTYDRSGYLLVRVAKDGPYGYLIRAIQKRRTNGFDTNGYAPEHRIVMHDKLGRQLRKGEVVDHIDGNRTNNHPSNLRVFASNAEHLRETLKGRIPNWTPEGKAKMTGRPRKSLATAT
jgi:hypothetical protein